MGFSLYQPESKKTKTDSFLKMHPVSGTHSDLTNICEWLNSAQNTVHRLIQKEIDKGHEFKPKSENSSMDQRETGSNGTVSTLISPICICNSNYVQTNLDIKCPICIESKVIFNNISKLMMHLELDHCLPIEYIQKYSDTIYKIEKYFNYGTSELSKVLCEMAQIKNSIESEKVSNDQLKVDNSMLYSQWQSSSLANNAEKSIIEREIHSKRLNRHIPTNIFDSSLQYNQTNGAFNSPKAKKRNYLVSGLFRNRQWTPSNIKDRIFYRSPTIARERSFSDTFQISPNKKNDTETAGFSNMNQSEEMRISREIFASKQARAQRPQELPGYSPESRLISIDSSCNIMPRNSPFEKENNFHARRDTKPACTYAQMIRKAIESSPSGSRTLSEIYNWMQMNYSYFANSPNSNWKNAVRHNLSLYAYFVRHRSPHGGSLWSIDSGLAEKHQQKSSQTPIATKAKSENKYLSPEQNSNLSNDGEFSIAGKDSSANGEISSTESIDSKSNDDENSEESEEIHKKIDLPTPKDCQQNSIPKNENIKNQNRKQHVTT